MAVAERLARVQLDNVDAVSLLDAAPAGAVIYCDPPYTASSDTTAYPINKTAGVEQAAINAAGPRRPCRRQRLPRRLAAAR